ncbi:hypothetical protein [uncultured Nostoc sp.]
MQPLKVDIAPLNPVAGITPKLVNYIAQKLEIEVTDDLRLIVETELKSA